MSEYAQNPEARYGAKDDVDRAFREVLAYRLYVDLRAGWRVTAPNLEQAGLLVVDYAYLDALCADQAEWAGSHEVLMSATPAKRAEVCRAVLDHLRRELAIKVDQLDPPHHDVLYNRSSQNLVAPWAIDEAERYQLERSRVVFVRARRRDDERNWVCLSNRSLVGQHLRRRGVRRGPQVRRRGRRHGGPFPGLAKGWARPTGHRDQDFRRGPISATRIPASALRWKAGGGEESARDLIRVPRSGPSGAGQARSSSLSTDGGRRAERARSREHTAQVTAPEREVREKRFRGDAPPPLPVLFCSPTMGARHRHRQPQRGGHAQRPPHAANYAQRSGRAGGLGQPALVVSYCSPARPTTSTSSAPP